MFEQPEKTLSKVQSTNDIILFIIGLNKTNGKRK